MRLRAALCFGWLTLSTSTAGGQPDRNPFLARARVHLAAVEYDLAQVALEDALRAGGNDPATTAEIHGLLGVVAGALDRPAQAEVAFERQLALVPSSSADLELGPKISAPFAAARAALAGRSLAVRVEPTTGGAISVSIVDDPLGMVAGGRAVFAIDDGGEWVATARDPRRLSFPLPTAAARSVTVAAVDLYGNRLVEVAVALPRTTTPAPTTRAPSPAPAPSRQWVLWAGGAAASAATGAVFGLMARSTRAELDDFFEHSAEHRYAEAEALDARGRRQTLVANVAFATAGACTVVAAVLFAIRRAPPVAIATGAVEGGGSLTVGGRF